MKGKIKALIILSLCFTLILGVVSSYATMSDLSEEEASHYYNLWTWIGIAGLAVFAVIMIAYYLNIKKTLAASSVPKKKRSKENELISPANTKKVRNAVIAIIAIGFVVRLALSIPDWGFANDIGCFGSWSRTAAGDLFNTYNNLAGNIDYPPGYVYILYVTGLLGKLFNCYNTGLYTLIVKLPAIICDCFIAWFIYLIAKERTSKETTLFFVLFWIANPAAVIDSTIWGQVDSVLSLALIAGLYLIMKNKFVLSSVVFGGAIMLKPQAIIVLPVLFYALLKNKKVKTIIFSFLAGAGTAILIALPFALNVDMSNEYTNGVVTPILEAIGANGGGFFTKLMTPFAWILSLFIGTAGHYSYATVNALNFFFMTGANWKQDSEPFLGFTYYTWGMIAIVVAALLVWVMYLISKKKDYMPFLASSVILLLVANFGPRMHERYFFPSIVLLLFTALIAKTKGTTVLAIAATVLGYLTVLEVLVDLNLGIPYMWPEVNTYRFILSLGNVALALGSAAYMIIDAFDKTENTWLGKRIWK